MKTFKGIISILFIFIWMMIIYSFSDMPNEDSNGKSKETIREVIEKILSLSNKKVEGENDNLELNNGTMGESIQYNNRTDSLVEKLNKPLRKFMHSTVYFVLAILLFNCFRIFKIKPSKNASFSIIISFLYACTDEYHQTFVDGRTGQISDVIIDTLGAICGVICIFIILKIIEKIEKNKKLNKLKK